LALVNTFSASVSMLVVLLQMRTSSAFSMESSKMVSLMLATVQAMIRSRHPASSWGQTLIEHKTMASLGMTVEDRQSKINTDIKKHAQELDRQNPGSTFEAELKAYGENGKYLALVTGTAKQALAIYRQFVSRRIGLIASRGWAQHIINRFRDAVSTVPTPSPVADAEFFAEADFSRNSRRGGYCGRSVPGA